jgi:outer membrane lipoprotein carrier protein
MALWMAALRAATVLFAVGAPGAAPGPAEEALRRVDERLQRATDLQARFVQTYRSATVGREVVERGSLALKRPGLMRWEYDAPEKKTFVSDGKSFYFYVPADRQVIVRDQTGSASGVAGLLLSGKSLLEQFEPGLETGATGQPRLRLVPRKSDPDVERIFLDVDASYRILAIEIQDSQGNRSRFDLTGLRENTGLPDKLFRFDVPRGVEVIAG